MCIEKDSSVLLVISCFLLYNRCKGMFWQILGKSIRQRKTRFAIAIVAVLIGVSTANALVMVSLDISEKVSREFAVFGANILLVSKSDEIPIRIGDVDYGSVTETQYIPEDDIDLIRTINWSRNILGYAPFLFSVVQIEGRSVVPKPQYKALRIVGLENRLGLARIQFIAAFHGNPG